MIFVMMIKTSTNSSFSGYGDEMKPEKRVVFEVFICLVGGAEKQSWKLFRR